MYLNVIIGEIYSPLIGIVAQLVILLKLSCLLCVKHRVNSGRDLSLSSQRRLGSMDSPRQGGTGMTNLILVRYNLLKITQSATSPSKRETDLCCYKFSIQ